MSQGPAGHPGTAGVKADKSAQITNFIRNIVEEDLASGKHAQVVTRFPPEPNGYLHIGHAKSICLNFGLAKEFKGKCHLRMDDTNPANEDEEYVEAIKEDVKWLGFTWDDNFFNASDYFEKLYEFGEKLITMGKAYVCELTPEQMREYRGTLTAPGKDSPGRQRSVDDNLKLFRDMRAGKFPDGSHTVRAKIDMSSGNINMRDPAIYRIKRVHHQQTGDKWCIYPMYDYAHCVSDALEGITHSLCTLEFQDHRPLYDWFLEQIGTASRPRQIEFSRLNITNTVMSKRKLKELVETKLVNGWDDPRLPTIKGMRRRGYPPEALRMFCDRIGVSKQDSVIDVAILEECVRDQLNENASRAMVVVDPIRLTLTNYDSSKEETLSAPAHPHHQDRGVRQLHFCNELLIERDDFMEDPPKDFFRLGPGKEVRLRNAYIVKCDEVIKNAAGVVTELRCSVDHATLGKNPEGRKVKGIIHWVSARKNTDVTVNLYDRLFTVTNPDADPSGRDYKDLINPHSKVMKTHCKGELGLATAKAEEAFQFERVGYFSVDPDSTAGNVIFNRSVSLKTS